MQRKKRHVWLYRFLFAIFRPVPWLRLRYTCKRAQDIEGPALIVANHTTDWDPILVALSFKRHMYFVASEHVSRWGLTSRLLRALFAPIVRVKGKTDARTGLEVIRTLRSGANVCLFAEGNRSFNGVTGDIFPATGKLAKSSGASLVTYRLEGGYFTSPRWSKTLRRGRMYGQPVQVYTPEQLSQMTARQINEAIQRDIHEDAYARQRETPIRYLGKRLAENLETALYLCPACGKAGTLHSSGGLLRCAACGLQAVYTEFGTLESQNTEFATVYEWDTWQKQQLPALIAAAGENAILQDEAQRLYKIAARVGSELVAQGALALHSDKLVCGDKTFMLQDISAMAITGQMTLTFGVGKDQYEILSDAPRSALKYLDAYKILTAHRRWRGIAQPAEDGKTPDENI